MNQDNRKKWKAVFEQSKTAMMVLFLISIFTPYVVFSGIFWGLWMASNGAVMLFNEEDDAAYNISFIAASVLYAVCEALDVISVIKNIIWIKSVTDNVGLFCAILLLLLLIRKVKIGRRFS